MKKLAFLSICAISMLLLGSCSKGVGCYYSATDELKEIKSDIKPISSASVSIYCLEEEIAD